MRVKQNEDDKELMRRIGQNVKFYRINNNCSFKNTDEYGRISQEKLAELAGTSASMIANVEAENVTQTMSIAFLRKISLALGVPLYAFFLERPIKNPPRELRK